MIAAALRTWVRYLVPFTALSALVFAPLLWFVARLPVPVDATHARTVFSLSWVIAGGAWFAQFTLVAAVAPAARAMANGEPLSQLRAFARGATNLLVMALPCAVAVIAIVIGGFALVVPGLALVVLLALTGASTEPGLPAPLLDSVAVSRANLRVVVIAVVAIVGADQAVSAIAYFALAQPLPAKPTFEQLAVARRAVRLISLALVAASPLAATVLATIRARTANQVAT